MATAASLCANSKTIPHRREPVNLQFVNLSYQVMESMKTSKLLLDNISGEFRAGELSAIMGPSGSGKSTLLNLLAGYRISATDGQINCNNHRLSMRKLRKISRYVLQDDQICPYFTVEETLMFAAHFKLAANCTMQERRAEVKKIMDNFHISQQAKTKVKHLSGGERKRVSIAMETLDKPPMIFLDEPTTGLDEFSAMQCITQLKQLAQMGHTVICSIHSPSAKMMSMFDSIYVLAQGQCVYQGLGSHIVSYLEQFDLDCPLTYNPADFIIEVAQEEYGDYHIAMVEGIRNGKILRWQPPKNECETKIQSLNDNNETKRQSYGSDIVRGMDFTLSRWSEYKILYRHNVEQLLKDKTNLYLRIIVHMLLSLMIAYCYYGIGNNAKYGGFNYNFCLLLTIMCAFISMTPMLSYVPRELLYLRRQHFNGWYRLETHYLAMVTAQVPLVCLMSFGASAVLYPLNGQPMELFRFCFFAIIVCLATLVGTSYGIAIGVRFQLLNALFMGPNILAIFVMFANIAVEKAQISLLEYMLMYCSFIRHGLEGLFASLYKYNREDLICPPSEFFCITTKPATLLKLVGCKNVNYLRSVISLIAFFGFFLVVAYAILKARLSSVRFLERSRHYRYLKRQMGNSLSIGVSGKY